ncbi:MAG: hypothetical protein ACJ8AI_27245 [Rhodopila sp.]
MNAIEIVALPRLRKEIAGFKAYPKRKELRPKNETTVKAIETLTANITDKGVWSQIVANSPEGDISKRRLERVADVVLNDMPHVLTALTKAMDNVTEGKGGRGAALHPKAPRPATVCAAFVTIVWVEAHRGEVPGPYDKAVWTACAALWRAAGGSRLDRAESSGWKNHLRAVADIPPALMDRFRKPLQNVRRLYEHGPLLAGLPAPPAT